MSIPSDKKPGKARIITVANQKGGVGKTTTTMNLGAALARSGRRVLLVDSDPQANLTSYLGVSPGVGEWEATRTLDEVYLSKRAIDNSAKSDFTAKTTTAGVHLIASEKTLSGVELYLLSRSDKELILARFLQSLADEFDDILIDTPPSVGLLTLNALCASDAVLIPVQPEFFSLEGIVKIRETIETVRSRWNAKIEILGVLPTQVSNRRTLTAEVLEALKNELGDLLFDQAIHDNSSVTESSGHGKSVLDYDRSSRGAKDYLNAAQEYLSRLDRLS